MNRSGIKVCDVLMPDATKNFDWIGFEGSGEVKGQISGEIGEFPIEFSKGIAQRVRAVIEYRMLLAHRKGCIQTCFEITYRSLPI